MHLLGSFIKVKNAPQNQFKGSNIFS